MGGDEALVSEAAAILPRMPICRKEIAYRLAVLTHSLQQVYALPAERGRRAQEKNARVNVARTTSALLWAFDALPDDAYDQLRIALETANPSNGSLVLGNLDCDLRHLFRVISEKAATPIKRGPPDYGPNDQAIFQIGFTYEALTGERPTNWTKIVPVENDLDRDRVERRISASAFADFARLMIAHAGMKLNEVQLRTALDKYHEAPRS